MEFIAEGNIHPSQSLLPILLLNPPETNEARMYVFKSKFKKFNALMFYFNEFVKLDMLKKDLTTR